jgi:hypothetical protein
MSGARSHTIDQGTRKRVHPDVPTTCGGGDASPTSNRRPSRSATPIHQPPIRGERRRWYLTSTDDTGTLTFFPHPPNSGRKRVSETFYSTALFSLSLSLTPSFFIPFSYSPPLFPTAVEAHTDNAPNTTLSIARTLSRLTHANIRTHTLARDTRIRAYVTTLSSQG